MCQEESVCVKRSVDVSGGERSREESVCARGEWICLEVLMFQEESVCVKRSVHWSRGE